MASLGLWSALLVALLVVGELAEAANVAVGRSGSMRPGKRTLALGRFNFRPGKRSSLALGRFNFRPGKRGAPEEDVGAAMGCGVEDLSEAAARVEKLLEELEGYSAYLKSCAAIPKQQ